MSGTNPPDPSDPYATGPTGGGASNPYGQAPPPPPGPGHQGIPGMSGGPMQQAPSMAQPGSIATAVKLMYAGAALSLLGLIVTLLTAGSLHDKVKETLQEQGNHMSESNIDNLVHFSIAGGIVLGLLGVGLWVWMAVMNGKGKSWARIVATVLGALDVVVTLVSFVQATPTGIGIVVNIISVVLAIVILVLLWRQESSAYYEAHAAPRY